MTNLDDIAEAAVKARRKRLLLATIEVALGELVATEGISEARAVLLRFARQLRYY